MAASPESLEQCQADFRKLHGCEMGAVAAEAERRKRECNVAAGMVQCSCCHGWFYDTPGNFCSFCN